ncbi:DUF4097 family beta strand repeat-containing protein [Streptomyces sp. CA-111067]|uniref:DUF4097 family beta strand repeat-containing protein n=1 Tax=Streptomyces sp. CA-111067 TaxID=3240046 RepID=UPI003D97064B
MTTKTYTATHSSSRWADITSPAGTVNVTVDPALQYAQITISTSAESGPYADAVRDTTIRETPGRQQDVIAVEVPEVPGQTMRMGGAVFTGANFGVVNTGTINGTVISNGDLYMGGHRIVSNGRVVAQAGTVVSGPAADNHITVDVRLPRDSSLRLTTTSADLAVNGALTVLTAESVSGDINARAVHTLDVQTTSGDVTVDWVQARLDARSVSGDVLIGAYSGSDFRANSTSGDITVSATPDAVDRLEATTVSGDITLRGLNDRLTPRTRTVSGDISRR